MNQPAAISLSIYNLLHRGIGIVYLTAIFPLFYQIEALIGSDGLQSAQKLIEASYQEQGIFRSVLQFPSVFHLFPDNITLLFLVLSGCIGALMLVLNFKPFAGAVISWISFLSLTTIGGDFFVIIIDLFLAETGFLVLFSTYYLSRHHIVPNLIDTVFKLLNFKLWFCMGINKFYLPTDVWSNWTFFDYYFHAQPMPSPLASWFDKAPDILKKIAVSGVFLTEIIIPFFIFGKRNLRVIAFIAFTATSVLIQLNGNFGYFNILSVVVALSILPSNSFSLFRIFNKREKHSSTSITIHLIIKSILFLQMSLQILYIILAFHPRPHSSQNHFNYISTYLNTENKFLNIITEPIRWTEYWRICNPYGVFKGIPVFHGEIRFSGSMDGSNWKTYEFRYLPSAQTDYLGFYAPFYPRLDHLMFYETLAAQNYRWNPLNSFNNDDNAWICNFISKLLKNDKSVTPLLKKNPFKGQEAPRYIKAEIFRLWFSREKDKNWEALPMNIKKIYSADAPCLIPVINFEEAMMTTYSKEKSDSE